MSLTTGAFPQPHITLDAVYEQIKIFFVNVEIFFRTQILYSTDDGGPAAGAVAKQRGGGERHGLGLAVARAGPHLDAARTPAHL